MADDNDEIKTQDDTNPIAPKLDTGIPDAATELDPANDLRAQDFGESGQFLSLIHI